MALRRPIVVIQGRFQELPVGDGIEASAEFSGVRVVVNDQGATVSRCTPVYLSSPGKFKVADPTTLLHSRLIGLVASASIPQGFDGYVQRYGVLVATSDEWSGVTDTGTALSPMTKYFLSMETGKITNVTPIESGSILVPVGFAMSETELELQIDNFRIILG